MNQEQINTITNAVTKALSDALAGIQIAPTKMSAQDLVELIEGMDRTRRDMIGSLIGLDATRATIKDEVRSYIVDVGIRAGDVSDLDSAIEEAVDNKLDDLEIDSSNVRNLESAIEDAVAEYLDSNPVEIEGLDDKVKNAISNIQFSVVVK